LDIFVYLPLPVDQDKVFVKEKKEIESKGLSTRHRRNSQKGNGRFPRYETLVGLTKCRKKRIKRIRVSAIKVKGAEE
jgi:hypothetical protein